MLSAKDVTVTTEWIKVFSVGDSGSGKSIFASSFPTPGFIFDFGKEIISYRGLNFDYEQYDLSAQGWGKFERDYITVKKAVEEKKYLTIVIDNLSAMTDVCMEKALQLDPKRSLTGGPLWQVHYAMIKNLMEGRLRQILNLNCNLIFIAHLDTLKDEEGAVIGVEPSLTGKLSVDIPAYFDDVFYHTVRKEGGFTKWYVQTIPIGRNHGRSRSSGKARLLPDLVENDYNEIMAYLTGKKKKLVQGVVTK
uniref:Putative ATPase domain containing protein n=1 Tax=viral metagenome TaxID=1070528 RepID=A0A6H1ZUF1_9ZZZZ